ncbi:MAG: hypothetical protein F6K03_15285 [Kamptonema sp. SIO4C4]|nr:hypothetical protein [Kamptonema sp. SIO4C4]
MKRKSTWLLSLAILTAVTLIGLSQFPNLMNSQVTLTHSTVHVQMATPSPEATESPTPTPSPEATESPTPTPSPEATEIPTPETTPVPETQLDTPSLPLAENAYQDPGKRFIVGVLQDYKQSVVSGVPLFESPDGQLAYTVAVRPRAVDSALREWALTQVAIDTFSRGEGMTTGAYETVETVLGGAKIPWTGQLTQGNNQQPMQGLMLSRQVPGRILILMIAATEEAENQVESVFNTLEPTLEGVNS